MGLQNSAGLEGKGFDIEVTRRLASYLIPYKRHVLIAVLMMLLAILSNVFGPLIVGYAIDNGLAKGDMGVVVAMVVFYVVLAAISNIAFRFQIHHMATAGQSIIRQLRLELFSHIQELSLEFFNNYKIGRLISRVIGDVGVLREMISFAIIAIARNLLQIVLIVVIMFTVNVPLALVVSFVLPILIVVSNVWRIRARDSYIAVRTIASELNGELAENFNGVRVIQSMSREDYNLARFTRDHNQKNLDANVKASLIAALFFAAVELLGGVALGGLVWVGGTLVLNNALTAGVLVAFANYLENLFNPIRDLAARYNTLQATMAAGEKIFQLMDTPVSVPDLPNAVVLPKVEGRVTFDHVNFSYSSDVTVLHDFSLDVPPGQMVALVGHTGAGKTSIIKLLTRFYDVSGGAVLIDGYDVRHVTQRSLRAQMGVVPQETFLFGGTALENIRYGRLDATDEEVIDAAKAVGAHEFIMQLPDGYHSELQEGGAILSVGQRQLIAFARCLLADPRILILDEATSSIDTRTEKVIQDALKVLLRGRTSFVIAHRLSTIVTADLIVVMDHGKIVEQGKHEVLLANRGKYHDLYTMAYMKPYESDIVA